MAISCLINEKTSRTSSAGLLVFFAVSIARETPMRYLIGDGFFVITFDLEQSSNRLHQLYMSTYEGRDPLTFDNLIAYPNEKYNLSQLIRRAKGKKVPRVFGNFRWERRQRHLC